MLSCAEFRTRREAGRDDFLMRQHAGVCRECATFAELAAWSRQLLKEAELTTEAPPAWCVMAAIRRQQQARQAAPASEWRLRRLLPYVVAVILLLLVFGTVGPRVVQAPADTDDDTVTVASSTTPSVLLLTGYSQDVDASTPAEALAGR